MAALALFGLWILAVGVVLLLARRDLAAGRAVIRSAHHRPLEQALSGGTVDDLQRAKAKFASAESKLASPVLYPIRVVPLLERQVRSVRALAAAGTRASTVAAGAVRQARAILDRPHGPGPERVALVRNLGALADGTERALGRVDLGPNGLLVPPVASARRQFRDELVKTRTALARAAFGASAAGDLLAGPRRYMLFAANNAEMRAGSGDFLSVGELDTSDGHLTLSHMTTVVDVPVPPGAVPLSGDLDARWGWLQPNVDWRNLMLSPRFDANAALAVQMWQASGHPPADGVLALDPVALQALLRAIGPVQVGDRTVDADHVVPELLHDQYTRFPVLEERPERREELSTFASAAMATLDGGHWSAARLGDQLGSAIRGRHIMAWSIHPPEQKTWANAGMGGILEPTSVLPAVINRGGNKLDQYVSVRADLQLHPSGNDTEATLTLHLRNDAPLNEINYIIGPHNGTGLTAGEYLGLIVFTLPHAASDARVDGVDSLAVVGPDGATRVIGGEFLLPSGAEHTAIVHFRLPGTHGTLRLEPSARVPSIEWQYGGKRWTDTERRTISW